MIFFQDSLIFQDKQNSEFWLRSAPADNNNHGLDVHFFLIWHFRDLLKYFFMWNGFIWILH